MAVNALKDRGWHLTEEGVELCTQNGGRKDVDGLIKAALDTDLKEIGQKWLSDDINRGRADYVQGPGVLQVQKIRNISAPKENEDSQAAPRLLKIVLTDGHIKCVAIETEALRDLGLNTPPGSKILLKSATDVEHGILLLNNKNIQYCGGRVSKLAEGWELKKKLAKQQRSNFGSGEEPPPFVPFGQRIDSSLYHKSSSRRDTFKSLETKNSEKTEDDEFEAQRKATIAEALKAKEDTGGKRFGGGQKSVAADHDIARIIEMGFRPDEAASALKLHSSNVQQAIEYLLSGKRRGPSTGSGRVPPGNNRQSSYEGRDGDRGRGRRDRKDDDTGAPGKGRRGREPAEESGDSRPSGPATLFDFLETKFPVGETKGTKKDEKSTFTKSNERSSSSYQTDQDASHSGTSHSQSDQYSYNQANRPKPTQNLPPRFVNKPRQDSYQGYNKGQGGYKDERPESVRDNRSKYVSNESRNSDDKNHNERNFNDSRYNDRNHDRNYGDKDRNFGNRDRNYGDRDRSFGNKDKNYGDREKNYGDKGKNYGDRSYNERNYGERDRNYGERNRNNYGGKDRVNYGESERNKNYYDKKGNEQDGINKDSNKPTNTNNSNGSKSDNSGDHKGSENKQNQVKQATDSRDSTQTKKTAKDLPEDTRSQKSKQTENSNHAPVPNTVVDNGKTQNTKYDSNSQTSSYNKTDSYSKGGYNRPQQSGYRNDRSQNYGANNNYGQHQQQPSPYNHSYNGTQGMVPTIHTSMGQYQQQPEFIYAEMPAAYGLKRGDKVMAKYWEDSLLYEAVVEVVAPPLPTCVVTFLEYGNSEEVLLTDVHPLSVPQMHQGAQMMQPPDLSVPPPQMFFSGPPPPHMTQGLDEVIQGISSIEFRRGGGGTAYHRKENRPAQQLYQPPSQRR